MNRLCGIEFRPERSIPSAQAEGLGNGEQPHPAALKGPFEKRMRVRAMIWNETNGAYGIGPEWPLQGR